MTSIQPRAAASPVHHPGLVRGTYTLHKAVTPNRYARVGGLFGRRPSAGEPVTSVTLLDPRLSEVIVLVGRKGVNALYPSAANYDGSQTGVMSLTSSDGP